MEFFEEYQNALMFGIVLNFVTTFGFGIYKAVNLTEEQMKGLMSKYQPRDDMKKIILLWFIPYVGFLYVFKEVWKLQRFINEGLGVYEYVEQTLKNRSN